LKVLLIEPKKVITDIDGQDSQFTNISFSVLDPEIKKYGYLEPINLEVGTDEATIHYTLPRPPMEST